MRRKPTATFVFRIVYALMIAAVAFYLGGYGPGLCGLAVGGLAAVVAGRLERRVAVPTGRPSDGRATRPPTVRFKRLWLVVCALVAVNAPIVYLTSSGVERLLAVAAAVLLVGGGAVAIIAMRKGDGGTS